MNPDKNSNLIDAKRAIRTIDSKKPINFTSVLSLFNPTRLVMRPFFKPDIIIKRRSRDIRNIANKNPIDYDLLAEYAADLIIACNKANTKLENRKK